MTELINGGFRAERAVSPRDGDVWWVVLDAELVAHREASAFLAGLHGAGRSPHTIRAYAGRAALFLGWCAAAGVDWRRIELAELARFKHWVEVNPTRAGRARSGTTVNAILTAVCELLRFCARSGLIEAAVAERLSEPRWLRFTPPGFDAGESGQFRGVRARALKARAATPFPEALTGEQLEQHIAALRADREAAHAIGAAAYVTDNLTAEIRAFSHVAEQMHRRLAELAPHEREEVEQASKLLRRARVARQLPVIAHPAPDGDTG